MTFQGEFAREQELTILLSRTAFAPVERDRVGEILSRPLNWEYLVATIGRHKVLPIFWHNLVQGDWLDLAVGKGGLPDIWLLYLSHLYTANHRRNCLFLDNAQDICAALQRAGVTALVLKGGALIGDIYDTRNRFLNDIDLLIDRCDIEATKAVFADCGYGYGRYDHAARSVQSLGRDVERAWLLQNHTLPTFYKTSDAGWIDYYKIQVGFDFFDPFEEYSADVGAVLEDAETKAAAGFKIPGRADMVVNLASHIYREGVSLVYDDFNINWQLTKFCDLFTYLSRYGDDTLLASVSDRVKPASLSEPLHFALFYTHEIYGADVLRRWLEHFDSGARDFLTELRDGQRRVRVDDAFKTRLFAIRKAKESPRGGWNRRFGKERW